MWYGWTMKGIHLYFHPGPLLEILTLANLRHAANRIWTYAVPEFRLCWRKMCSSDNQYTKAPQCPLRKFSINSFKERSKPKSAGRSLNCIKAIDRNKSPLCWTVLEQHAKRTWFIENRTKLHLMNIGNCQNAQLPNDKFTWKNRRKQ